MKTDSYLTRVLNTLLPALLLAFMFTACDSSGSEENGPSFASGSLDSGESYSFTFEEEGTVSYYCENHQPDMTGQVNVEAGAESASPDTVIMDNLQFSPSTITVAPNTEIVWVNQESSAEDPHTVTSGTPGDSGGGIY